MEKHTWLRTLVAVAALSAASTAHAQSSAPTTPWSLEVAFGADKTITGNINSGAIGRLNGQTAVILKNAYEDVYGTGINLRFGGGYMWKENTEIVGIFTFTSMDADLTPMGDLGVSRLYGQYSSYQSFGLEVGLRRYVPIPAAHLNVYGEGLIGAAFIDRTNIDLAAPTANVIINSTDFYDKTSAFSMGFNGGAMFPLSPHFSAFGQAGLRFMTGQRPVDQLIGTGLEHINDSTSRWTIPVVFGVRYRF